MLQLVRLNLRLRRFFILWWWLGITALLAMFGSAYESYYPTPESREAFRISIGGNAGMSALWGELRAPVSIGQLVAWEGGGMALILAAVMGVLLFQGLYRRPEATGQTELARATGISRRVPLSAAIATTAIVAVLVGLGAFLALGLSGLEVEGMPWDGAAAFGLALALSTIGSALVSGYVSLVVADGRAAGRTGLFSVAVMFILRSVADSQGIDWLHWLTPLGWKTLIAPYIEDDFAIAGALVAVLVLAAMGLVLADSPREHQQALLHLPQRGTARHRGIANPLHLEWLNHKGTVVAWVIAIGMLNGFMVGLTGSLKESFAENEYVQQILVDYFGTGASPADASLNLSTDFIQYSVLVGGVLLCCAAVGVVLSYRGAEKDGLVDLSRSTGIKRWHPLALVLAVAIIMIVVVLVIAGLTAAGALAAQDTTVGQDYATLTWAVASELAPALFFTGIAAMLVGWVPRWSSLTWLVVGAATVLTLFGPLLQAPDWLMNLSPFEHVMSPDVTLASDVGAIQVALVLAGLVLAALGCLGAQRRQVL